MPIAVSNRTSGMTERTLLPSRWFSSFWFSPSMPPANCRRQVIRRRAREMGDREKLHFSSSQSYDHGPVPDAGRSDGAADAGKADPLVESRERVLRGSWRSSYLPRRHASPLNSGPEFRRVQAKMGRSNLVLLKPSNRLVRVIEMPTTFCTASINALPQQSGVSFALVG